jgi:predicted aspartyl protease
VGFTAVLRGAESKPNFSGIWKLLNGEHPQIMIIDQNETELRVFQLIEDRLSMDRGLIDGQSHSQTVDGRAWGFLARWEGDSLFFETKRDLSDSIRQVVYTQHLMRLAADGKTMNGKRTQVTPQPATFREKWAKQDPLAREDVVTPFDGRLKLDDHSTELTGVEGNRLRGWMAHAFNDVPQAERELLPIVNQEPPSKFRDEARERLAEVYVRNGMVRKALPYCRFLERTFVYDKLAKYPEMSVSHRGYARVQATRDSDGHIMLPVTAAGKEASYIVDTGANVSMLRMSEAGRLGLKLELWPRIPIMNGIVKFWARLAIVPVLTVGTTRFENVPFWVVPDTRLDCPGIIGIGLLLKLETLRWNARGDVEIGFPAQEKNIRNANLCFWDHDLLTDATSNGQGGMIFFLDTGSYHAQFYPRFAAHFQDLVSANGKKSLFGWYGLGGHRDLMELTMPEITLSIGGAQATMRSAGVLLEKPPLHSKIHGVIGMDVLNSASRVTLDLQAMRLTIEGADADLTTREAVRDVHDSIRH